MNQNVNEKSQDAIIRFDDLVFYCCAKWKQVLLCMLVGAVLLGVYAKQKSKKLSAEAVSNYEALVAAMQDDSELTAEEKSALEREITEYESDMDDASKDEMNNVVNQLTVNQQMVDKIEEYMANSLIMQADSVNEVVTQRRYIISIDASYENILDAYTTMSMVVDALNNYLLSDACLDAAAKKLETETSYIKEMLGISDTLSSELLPAIEAAGGNGEILESYTPKAYFYMETRGTDESMARYLSDYLDQAIKDFDKGEIPGGDDVSLDQLSLNAKSVVDSSSMTNRYNWINQINTARNNILNVLSKLTEDELQYVYNRLRLKGVSLKTDFDAEAVYADSETEAETVEAADQTAVEASVTGAGTEVTLSVKKYGVVGALAGAALALLMYIASYIFSARIKSVYAIEDTYHVRSFWIGRVGKGSRDPLTKFFESLRYRNSHQYTAGNIAGLLKVEMENAGQKKRIAVVSSEDSILHSVRATEVAEALKGAGFEVECVTDAAYDAVSAARVLEMDAALVVEQVDVSMKREVSGELDFLFRNARKPYAALMLV